MKIIKFDTLYPASLINKKTIEAKSEIDKMTYLEFHNWLINLRLTFSDYYSYNLSIYGWDSKEFFLDNKIYQLKCGKHYFGYALFWVRAIHKLKNIIYNEKKPFSERLVRKIIDKENPDILYIREQCNIRSKFWEQYKNTKLVVSRMDCYIPRDWSPLSFDMIYTNIPSYIDFFRANNVKTYSNSNGFDFRVLSEIKTKEKKYDVVYIGGFGNNDDFRSRSDFFESVLSKSNKKFNFACWGTTDADFAKDYPRLAEVHNGESGGIDMLSIYAQSKIVLNFYDVTIAGIPGNLRMFETMGVGTLLLTKHSKSIEHLSSCLATYTDVDDCITMIDFLLGNEEKRKEIAKNGQDYIKNNFDYKDLMGIMSQELTTAYNNKFRV